MPIYEFRCASCGEEFETLVFARDARADCPKCGGTETRKLMSTFASKAGEKFTPATGGGSNCSGCASKNCATCG
jgi:putative FmdB family regulatory protein